MWFREECHVKTMVEKIVDDDFWKTPGGVVLALFIAFVCVFCLWWLSLCYRNRAVVGVCDGMQQIDMDNRLAGKRRRGGHQRVSLDDEDGDDDILYSSQPRKSETRVRVGAGGRKGISNSNIYDN